ncbi:FecCD family ABC transporter permease [Aestuariispira ectoiniformans]|uniref:FecCD family ABC transporter permease n=1 Tax=Aestuariispira ectoiniformans TaxID=2775080 RepID=UPI00223B56DB|nr:iron ABC transporter permease [Aestuariispira ectoiniformans]
MSELSQTAGSAPSLAAQYRKFVYRRVFWLSVLLAALVVAVAINVAVGPSGMGLSKLIAGLIDPSTMDTVERLILWDIRLPFALMAVCVGACLGLAGAEMQTVLNNPLASPSTMGVMYAATLGASLAIVLRAEVLGIPENYIIPFCAFAGAMAAMVLIQFLSRLFGATVNTVVLFGIAMVFALEALVQLIQFAADSDSLQQIVFWTMGSLSRASWEKVGIVSLIFLACVPFSIRHMWKMTILRGGEDYARSFGVSVDRLGLIVLLRVSVLTAGAVAFTGVLGFVGLVGPHIARMAFGEDHRFYLPGSALAGAFILATASIFSKTLVPGVMVPEGIVTALIGIPIFLGLLVTQRRRGG